MITGESKILITIRLFFMQNQEQNSYRGGVGTEPNLTSCFISFCGGGVEVKLFDYVLNPFLL